MSRMNNVNKTLENTLLFVGSHSTFGIRSTVVERVTHMQICVQVRVPPALTIVRS